jgi:membrane-associated phospholipid phosphatase
MMLGMLLAYPLAASAFPLRDADLNAVDLWLGLDWRAFLQIFNAHPLVGLVGKVAYWSMGVQALFVIVALVASSNFLRLHQYIIAVAIGLVTTVVIFTFMPATGTYSYLHIAPEDYANVSPTVTFGPFRHLQAIRSGNSFLVTADDLEGLVAFPSFHTVCSLLYTWALFPLRNLRWPVASLNALVIAAAPIEGAHYFIDLIGGGVVAFAAIITTLLVTGAIRAPGAIRALSRREHTHPAPDRGVLG